MKLRGKGAEQPCAKTASGRLRAGPDNDYPTLRRINRNTRVSVYGCLRDWSWCDVSYQRDRGWVPGRDIAASYQGRRRSINSIAPYLGIGVLSFSFGMYWDDHYRERTFYRERDRWERQYNQNYKPVWGPRQDDSRDRVQPRRDEPQPPVQRQGQVQPPIQPSVRTLPPGQSHVQAQPAVQPPGQKQGPVKQKPNPAGKKPKPGDPGYVRPGQTGPNP